MNKNMINATIDTIIINTSRMKELAEFYRNGFQLDHPNSHADNHLGFQMQSVYFGFDKVDETPSNPLGPISVWFRVDTRLDKRLLTTLPLLEHLLYDLFIVLDSKLFDLLRGPGCF